jgi:hypothetical protein
VATDSKPPLCDAWSCVNGEVVGPYDTPMLCGKCKGTGRLPAPEEWPNATPHPAGEPDRLNEAELRVAEPVQPGAEAVVWQTRVRERRHEDTPWMAWEEWEEVSADVAHSYGFDRITLPTMQRETRALYTHPKPEPEPSAFFKASESASSSYAAPVGDELRAAVVALIARWHTPLWKDVPATATYIQRLERALATTKKEGRG